VLTPEMSPRCEIHSSFVKSPRSEENRRSQNGLFRCSLVAIFGLTAAEKSVSRTGMTPHDPMGLTPRRAQVLKGLSAPLPFRRKHPAAHLLTSLQQTTESSYKQTPKDEVEIRQLRNPLIATLTDALCYHT